MKASQAEQRHNQSNVQFWVPTPVLVAFKIMLMKHGRTGQEVFERFMRAYAAYEDENAEKEIRPKD